MIRPTFSDDCESLISLAVASGLFDPDQTDLLSEMLQNPDETHIWLTDCDEDRPVGVAYFAPEMMTHGTWNLYWIAVHPDFQKTGRGSAILKHVESLLKERGERILLVETAGTDDFDYVRSFYAKHGFEDEGRIRDFYDDGVDKIIFRKALVNAAK